MLTPVMTLIVFVFIGGLSMGLAQSFGYFPAIGLREVSLKYYMMVFSNPEFKSALTFSLYTSFVSSVLSVLVGLLLAYLLLKSGVSDRLSSMLYRLPIVVPHAIAALLIYTLFAQSGVLSRLLYLFGFITESSQMPVLLFDRTGKGVMLAYVWKATPFIAMVVFDILKSVTNRLEEAAFNLGASEWQVFRYVILPLIAPTLLANFIIIFAFSFGAFEIPYLLGPTAPKALPILSYIEYTNPDLSHRPYTMAINMVLTGVSLFIVGLTSFVFKPLLKYKD
ncbi:MAG: ABC transporter permease subunit [Clostridia bacterium]|nr:ABC transporter permease subunit [Clostridia bacterium]